MSTALAPWSAAPPARRAAPLPVADRMRPGTAIATAEGNVAALFSLERFDRRRGVAIYALRVVNHTGSELVCRTLALSRTGEAMLAYPVPLRIVPYSASSTRVPVWIRDFPNFDHAIAEVVGNGIRCVVEAAAPQLRPRRNLHYRIAAASLAAALLVVGTAQALRTQTPRIQALAAPPQALAGSTVQAQYAAAGAGDLSYTFTAPDGKLVQAGGLRDRSGFLYLALGPNAAAGPYVLRVAMNGALGEANDVRVIDARAAAAQSAQIANLSVHPAVAQVGQPIEVAYSAAADGGYVRLVDDNGTIWGQQPFSAAGESQLIAPPVTTAREMRVLLHVTKANSSADSMAGVLVTSAIPHADAVAAPSDSSDEAGAPASDANGTFALAAGTVASGGVVAVRIISPRNGMRISLNDPQSREIAGTDVGDTADVITLRAPVVSVPTKYTVVATFTDGFGQESVVEALKVLPK